MWITCNGDACERMLNFLEIESSSASSCSVSFPSCDSFAAIRLVVLFAASLRAISDSDGSEKENMAAKYSQRLERSQLFAHRQREDKLEPSDEGKMKTASLGVSLRRKAIRKVSYASHMNSMQGVLEERPDCTVNVLSGTRTAF